jgi:mannosyltransferase
MNADRATSLRLAILAILLLSFIIRLAGLNAQSIWRDEADSLRFAGSPALLTQMLTEPGHNGPLYYVLLRGWLGLVGPGLTAARLFSALWGTLTVALVYAVGRRLFTVSVAALAALLAGVSPYLVWYSQEARMYAPALAVGLLALRLLLAALKRGGAGRWLIYVLSAGLSLYLHLAAALLIPVHILAGLLTRRRLIYLAALGLLLTAGPLLSWIIPFLLHPIVIGRAPARPADMFAGLLLALTAGPSGLFSLWTALPGLFLALAGAALAPAGERRPVGLALAWVLLPLAGLALLALSMQDLAQKRPRALVARGAVEHRWRRLLDDLPLIHEDDAAGRVAREPHLVADHHHGHPSRARSSITSSTSLIISGSSALVGSSKSMILGCIANARAIATRCCCPPESCPG